MVQKTINELNELQVLGGDDLVPVLADGELVAKYTKSSTIKTYVKDGMVASDIDDFDAAVSASTAGTASTAHIANISNPHSVTKTQVGLGNCDNTSDANKPVSTATQTALDDKVTKNANITGATKTKITYDAKGLVTSGADATTADIADSTNKRYVTDANLVTIGNQSGTNTGDETTATIKTKLGAASTLADGYLTSTDWNTFNGKQPAGSYEVTTNKKTSLTDNSDTFYPTQKAVKTAVDAKQDTLVNQTNIKSINGETLLGSGDLVVAGTGHIIQDEGTPLTSRASLNFVGTGVEATDDEANNATKITITAGTGGQVDSVVAGTGISVNATDPANPIVTNSAPDQAVSIAAGTGIGVAGTYPSFTVSNTVVNTDEKVKYDVADPTAGYVADKVIAGDGISVAEGTGADENKLVVTNTDKGSSVDLSGKENTSNKKLNLTDNSDDYYVSQKGIATALSGKQDSLGFTPEDVANKKTDLSDNSDTYYPSQKAVKTAVDAKFTNSMSTNKLLGRATVDTGPVEEITLGTGLAFDGTTLNGQNLSKAAGTDINTGTDDAKYVTSKAIADSKVSITDGTETLSNKTLDVSNRVVGATANTQANTTYTFVLTDAGKLVTFGNGAATTITVPKNDTVDFPIGSKIDCLQLGAGKVTFAGAADVTLSSKGGNKAIGGQYVGVTLIKTAANTRVLVGDLIA